MPRYLLFFSVNIFFILSYPIHAISINEVKLCKDTSDCKTTIENNATINISNINKIWVTVNINNESSTNEILLVRFLFKPSQKINFDIKDSIFNEPLIKKPSTKSKRSDKCKKCNVFDVRLNVESSPSYRTKASKKIDKNVHIGNWKIKLIDSNNTDLYSESLILEK